MNQPHGVEAAIRATFEKVVRDGLRRESVAGADDREIDRMAADQGVAAVPVAVREVLRLIGRRSGLWFPGTDFGVGLVTGRTKQDARAALEGLSHEVRSPDGIFVLSAHQGHTYHFIDGADLGMDDPPVWVVTEHEEVVRDWGSTTEWFAAMDPDVEDYREMLEMMTELGRQPPGWAEDLEPR
ncbi:hypothetical protein ACIQMJ_30155 [Actinosynnema sp. NPDC091369]